MRMGLCGLVTLRSRRYLSVCLLEKSNPQIISYAPKLIWQLRYTGGHWWSPNPGGAKVLAGATVGDMGL
jgi:hypothetical protein